MSINTGELDPIKYLLVWPFIVPNAIRVSFTMVFIDVVHLIKYICRVLTKTDTFHLIIPLDCLGHLLRDPIYQFVQVVHITVICDSLNKLRLIEPCFVSGFEKIYFCTIYDVLEQWKNTMEIDGRLVSSSPTYRYIKNVTISSIQTLASVKLTDTSSSSHRSRVLTQFPTIPLHGFSVKNIENFIQRYTCPSCGLVDAKLCQLNCGHQLCRVCVNCRKGCEICSKDVSTDQVTAHQNLQLDIQDLETHCPFCDRIELFKDYEVHLQQNHSAIITGFICNREAEENTTITSFNGGCVWEVSS